MPGKFFIGLWKLCIKIYIPVFLLKSPFCHLLSLLNIKVRKDVPPKQEP